MGQGVFIFRFFASFIHSYSKRYLLVRRSIFKINHSKFPRFYCRYVHKVIKDKRAELNFLHRAPFFQSGLARIYFKRGNTSTTTQYCCEQNPNLLLVLLVLVLLASSSIIKGTTSSSLAFLTIIIILSNIDPIIPQSNTQQQQQQQHNQPLCVATIRVDASQSS